PGSRGWRGRGCWRSGTRLGVYARLRWRPLSGSWMRLSAVEGDEQVASLGQPRPWRHLDDPPQVPLSQPRRDLTRGLGGALAQDIRCGPEERELAIAVRGKRR